MSAKAFEGQGYLPVRPQQQHQRKPKKITPTYLERAALAYLERFNATERRLTEVMTRKVLRRAQITELSDEVKSDINDLVEKCARLGYVDDRRFGAARMRALLERGKPIRMIRADLIQKGVPVGLADELLAALREENPEADLAAAERYAQRRRFGPYARPGGREIPLEKQKAAMARAGFSFDVVNKILSDQE